MAAHWKTEDWEFSNNNKMHFLFNNYYIRWFKTFPLNRLELYNRYVFEFTYGTGCSHNRVPEELQSAEKRSYVSLPSCGTFPPHKAPLQPTSCNAQSGLGGR